MKRGRPSKSRRISLTMTDWTDEDIDEFMRDVQESIQESREFLADHRSPPPRDGKYNDAPPSAGAIPVADLESHNV